MHLETGLPNRLEKNWYVGSILKGVRRVKGDASVQKLPITPDILRQVLLTLDLYIVYLTVPFGRHFKWDSFHSLGNPISLCLLICCLTHAVICVQMMSISLCKELS